MCHAHSEYKQLDKCTNILAEFKVSTKSLFVHNVASVQHNEANYNYVAIKVQIGGGL